MEQMCHIGINITQIITMTGDYFIWIVRKDLSEEMTFDCLLLNDYSFSHVKFT